ncbi:MAG: four helix bundle protein [Rickettsiales bacterium]
MGNISSYKDLDVWKRARILVKNIYILTKQYPKEELFALVSQTRRAAISIPANIAEGFSRHGTKDYIAFISVAIGSLAELETLLILAEDIGYIECSKMLFEINQLQKMLHSLRKSLKEKI